MESTISCTYSRLDGWDLSLRRRNWKENLIHIFRTWWVRSIFKERELKGEFMRLFRTWWVRSIFKERKLKGEFHALIQHLMGQIYFQIEKIKRRISCTFSGLGGSDLFSRRKNWKENLMHLFNTWWLISIFKERKLKGEFQVLIQVLMGQMYF